VSEFSETAYGFTWGQVKVERLISVEPKKGRGTYRVLSVDTEHSKLEITVSPTGRSVRVFRDGKELK